MAYENGGYNPIPAAKGAWKFLSGLIRPQRPDVPNTHVDAYPEQAFRSTVESLREVAGRNNLNFNEGQLEMIARSMLSGEEVDPQRLEDYGLSPTDVDPTSWVRDDYNTMENRLNEAGYQGPVRDTERQWSDLGDSGMEYIADNNLIPKREELARNHIGSLNGMVDAAGSQGMFSNLLDYMDRMAGIPTDPRMKNIENSAGVYARGKDAEQRGSNYAYDSLLAGPNYYGADAGAMFSPNTLLGGMENYLGDWQRRAEYNQQTGMDAENPQNPEVVFSPTVDTFGHSMRQTLRGTGENWGTGKAGDYSRSLVNARHAALSNNPHVPGANRAEREANQRALAELASNAETPEAQEVSMRNTGKPMSTAGATALTTLEGFADPTIAIGIPGAVKGVKTLAKGAQAGRRAMNAGEAASEGIQEGVTAFPDAAIAAQFPFDPEQDMPDHQQRLDAQKALMNSEYAKKTTGTGAGVRVASRNRRK